MRVEVLPSCRNFDCPRSPCLMVLSALDISTPGICFGSTSASDSCLPDCLDRISSDHRAGLKFRETPGDYDFDFHCAPARQFIVSLDSGVDIEVTDGTRRVFPAGTVMLAEDTWGKVSLHKYERP